MTDEPSDLVTPAESRARGVVHRMVPLARELEPTFRELLAESSPFEPKGIFSSELLMFCTSVRALGVEHVVESGRARGQSTEVIARFARREGIAFDSIERTPDSPDAAVAEERLRPLSDAVTLHYGDSFELLPHLIDARPTALLVDGPKGNWALKLGLPELARPSVRAVFFHDVHRDAANARPKLDRYFPVRFFSDDRDFVEAFRHLDDACWRRQREWEAYRDWGPYRRGEREMQSYAATLGGILNEGIEEHELRRCLAEVEKEIPLAKRLARGLRARLRSLVR